MDTLCINIVVIKRLVCWFGYILCVQELISSPLYAKLYEGCCKKREEPIRSSTFMVRKKFLKI